MADWYGYPRRRHYRPYWHYYDDYDYYNYYGYDYNTYGYYDYDYYGYGSYYGYDYDTYGDYNYDHYSYDNYDGYEYDTYGYYDYENYDDYDYGYGYGEYDSYEPEYFGSYSHFKATGEVVRFPKELRSNTAHHKRWRHYYDRGYDHQRWNHSYSRQPQHRDESWTYSYREGWETKPDDPVPTQTPKSEKVKVESAPKSASARDQSSAPQVPAEKAQHVSVAPTSATKTDPTLTQEPSEKTKLVGTLSTTKNKQNKSSPQEPDEKGNHVTSASEIGQTSALKPIEIAQLTDTNDSATFPTCLELPLPQKRSEEVQLMTTSPNIDGAEKSATKLEFLFSKDINSKKVQQATNPPKKVSAQKSGVELDIFWSALFSEKQQLSDRRENLLRNFLPRNLHEDGGVLVLDSLEKMSGGDTGTLAGGFLNYKLRLIDGAAKNTTPIKSNFNQTGSVIRNQVLRKIRSAAIIDHGDTALRMRPGTDDRVSDKYHDQNKTCAFTQQLFPEDDSVVCVLRKSHDL